MSKIFKNVMQVFLVTLSVFITITFIFQCDVQAKGFLDILSSFSSSSSSNDEKTEETFPVEIALYYEPNIIFSRDKKFDVYIDNKKYDTIIQGQKKSYNIFLTEGVHTLKLKSSTFNSDKLDFRVTNTEIATLFDNYFCYRCEYTRGDIIITGDSSWYGYEVLEYVYLDNFKEKAEKYYNGGSQQFNQGNETGVTQSQEDNYILPDSSTKKIALEDLSQLNAKQLKIARNEIYARHGYIFKDEQLNDYFNSKNWYTPIGNDVNLNEIELYNIEIIKEAESYKND